MTMLNESDILPSPVVSRVPSVRLRSYGGFTVRGERACHDCGIEFVRGDEAVETRLHTQTREQGEPHFVHKSCWDKRSVGVFYPESIFTWSDTREFTSEASTHLTIVVQVAVCTDPDSGQRRLGRCTYFITCDFASDPLFAYSGIETVYAEIEGVEVTEEQAQAYLAGIDPGEFTWDGGAIEQVHGPGTEWVARFWPETITARHAASSWED